MKVTQVAEILRDITKEVLGDSVIVNEDLSNVVDVGKAFENLENGYDNYVRKLHDHIGKVIYTDRLYKGRAPSVVMDGWEYGSILEKIRVELPEADINESWELQDGASYDPNIFRAPKVSVKFFNKKVTFEYQASYTEKQIKSSFSNATQLNAFYSAIASSIANAFTKDMDALVMRTINAGIGETMNNGGIRAINLLTKYNTAHSATLTPEQAITDPDFLRFAALQLSLYVDRMATMSNLFNIGKTTKFTDREHLKIVMLSDFASGANVYLQSETFHNEFTKFPEADTVPFWQGSGAGYAFNDISKIDVITPTGETASYTGILATMFDRDALGVANVDRRVKVHQAEKGEFWNEFHKYDAGYYLDLDENMIVFYIANE